MAKITTQNIKNKKGSSSDKFAEDQSLYGNVQRFSEWAEENARLLIIGFMSIVVVCVCVMAFQAYQRSQAQGQFKKAYTIEQNFSNPKAAVNPQVKDKKLSTEEVEKIHSEVLAFVQDQPESPASRNLALKWVSKLYDLKNYEKALEIIKIYKAQGDGLSGLSLLLKGSTLMQAQNYKEAIQAFQSIIENKNFSYLHSEATYQKSLAQIKNNDIEGAVTSLKNLRENYADDEATASQALKVMRWLKYQKAQKQ